MIEYCGAGDVLAQADSHIVIPVNLVGVMGSGLARWYADRYPRNYQVYRKACLDGRFKPGMLMTQSGNDGRRYLLFPTKVDWKLDSTTELIELGLQKLVMTHEQRGIDSLAMPPIGCGKGNLDFWTQVHPLLYQYLDRIPLRVNIFLR